MQNYIENTFYNEDIYNIIFSFLPYSSQIFMFKIFKHSPKILCNHCNKKICCPIIYNNNISCFTCINEELYYYSNEFGFNSSNFSGYMTSEPRYAINKKDKLFWEECEKIEKKYVTCKHCKIKCSSIEWLHYHINFRCTAYNPVPIKRQYAEN
tara:strand:- start:402 stop:860 length:459 start_codon:yes stop_codon:yes gene_type:complete